MQYVVIHYHETPGNVLTRAATRDPAEAVALLRFWHHTAPDDGVLVRLGDRDIIHCAPHH